MNKLIILALLGVAFGTRLDSAVDTTVALTATDDDNMIEDRNVLK